MPTQRQVNNQTQKVNVVVNVDRPAPKRRRQRKKPSLASVPLAAPTQVVAPNINITGLPITPAPYRPATQQIFPENPMHPPQYFQSYFTNQEAAMNSLRNSMEQHIHDMRNEMAMHATNAQRLADIDAISSAASGVIERELNEVAAPQQQAPPPNAPVREAPPIVQPPMQMEMPAPPLQLPQEEPPHNAPAREALLNVNPPVQMNIPFPPQRPILADAMMDDILNRLRIEEIHDQPPALPPPPEHNMALPPPPEHNMALPPPPEPPMVFQAEPPIGPRPRIRAAARKSHKRVPKLLEGLDEQGRERMMANFRAHERMYAEYQVAMENKNTTKIRELRAQMKELVPPSLRHLKSYEKLFTSHRVGILGRGKV